ncbi:CopG family transcriptional regulator [Leptospira tipperaryensis]|uniref:CopG family transcriptional regulator n=1 Tax=Leptospira tipperaryensis TaxID=2564040 RepID=A0A1D7V053_9LEPT|nr:DUF1564 domain-containing protein [Leptospira tipperaryensis]AOP35216.1 CopG family transcriptional regulator [Leptospira tipperaryensis]
MGILLLNSDQELKSNLRENNSDVVTLLIPKKTLYGLSESEMRKLPKRIPGLLSKYGKYLTSSRRLGKKAGKILYQPSAGKENMLRINVRIGTGSWALLGALAQAHGVSRCYLFNYLLWLDEIGMDSFLVRTMNEGAPTFHRNYRFILHLDLLNNKITRRLECDPANLFSILDYRDWFDS